LEYSVPLEPSPRLFCARRVTFEILTNYQLSTYRTELMEMVSSLLLVIKKLM
jgi:hypothetical protein